MSRPSKERKWPAPYDAHGLVRPEPSSRRIQYIHRSIFRIGIDPPCQIELRVVGRAEQAECGPSLGLLAFFLAGPCFLVIGRGVVQQVWRTSVHVERAQSRKSRRAEGRESNYAFVKVIKTRHPHHRRHWFSGTILITIIIINGRLVGGWLGTSTDSSGRRLGSAALLDAERRGVATGVVFGVRINILGRQTHVHVAAARVNRWVDNSCRIPRHTQKVLV
jgi:hypothetical protein